MRLICAGLTDVGMARDHNEDTFYLSPDEALCIVADGMGGHSAGEVASGLAIEEIVNYYRETADSSEPVDFPFWPFRRKKPESREERRLIASMTRANERIYEEASSDENKRGMGTTLMSVFFIEEGVRSLAEAGTLQGSRGAYRLARPVDEQRVRR